MENLYISDVLYELLQKHRQMIHADIDAANCQTRSDHEKADSKQEEFEEFLELTINKLTKG